MSKFDNVEMDKISKIKLHIESNSEQMDSIIEEITASYVDELDKYVRHIDDRLCQKENPPTDAELESFCLNLSTLIYFASGMCEQLGIRDDIAKAIYKETYNNAYSNQIKGTIDDKRSISELESQQEQLISICYTRAYKTVKAKIDSAQELLASCKKAVSRRMQEQQLTNMIGG